jgi:hypothetical protein
MRKFTVAAVAAIALSVAVAGAASASAQIDLFHHKKTLGYQDENGTFHPFAHTLPDAATATTVTGTIEVTIKLTIKSSFPSGTKIYCGADTTVESINDTNPLATVIYGEEGASIASGTTCTVKIPYAWTINAAGVGITNYYTGSYAVVAYDSSLPTFTYAIGFREVTGTYVDLGKIPVTGSTTPYTVDVTI